MTDAEFDRFLARFEVAPDESTFNALMHEVEALPADVERDTVLRLARAMRSRRFRAT